MPLTDPHIVIIKEARQRSSLTLTAAGVYHKVIPIMGPGGNSNTNEDLGLTLKRNWCIFLV